MAERPIPVAREGFPCRQGVALSGDAVSRHDGECEERLHFERLLSSLSACFIHITAEELDAGIEEAQRRICEFLDVDLSALWQLSDEAPDDLVLTHLYSAQDGPRPPGQLKHEDFPWVVQQMRAGRTVVLSSLDELPAEAIRDRDMARQLGIKSSLVLPLAVDGKPAVGVLGLNTLREERDWTEALVNRLQLVAQLFANALARRQADATLLQSEARLASAVEIAELGFYEVVDGKRFTFLDSLGRNLVGIPDGQDRYEYIYQFWADHLHPEDKPRVLEVYRKRGEGVFDRMTLEYRYLHPQRGTIWIQHLTHVLDRDIDGQLRRIIGILRDITGQKTSEERLRKALEEVQRLRDRLQMENVYLREQLKRDDGQDAIVGESEAVLQMLAQARKVAPTDATVLITGETGTGKELLAQAIHDLSPRQARPMVKVNCAALPAPLIEGELFGREKGAYTGAMTQQHGRFEVAHGSTIFLDEIGDLPVELQTKLLRVLQDGQFERLGSHSTLTVDVRVIAATNHDLVAMVREGRFREDLFHRLNVFPIEVPPLRARAQDITALVWGFVREFNATLGRAFDSIPRQTIEQLKQYPWPGNIRELRNMVERAMITSEGHSLELQLPEPQQNLNARPALLEEVERKHIISVLERARWRISGKDGAAEILGLVPTTLHSRMKKLGISRPNA